MNPAKRSTHTVTIALLLSFQSCIVTQHARGDSGHVVDEPDGGGAIILKGRQQTADLPERSPKVTTRHGGGEETRVVLHRR